MLDDLLSNNKYSITGVCQNTSTDISNKFTNQALAMVPMVKPNSDFQNLSNLTFKVTQVESSTTVHTVDF